MPDDPGNEVKKAIELGTSQVIRRVAIFEQDGVTAWNPDVTDDPDFQRLVDGSVTADSTRDERRNLDLTLSNTDKLLRPGQTKLWYDKVIKIYRGIEFESDPAGPEVVIIEGAYAIPFLQQIQGLGYTSSLIFTAGLTYNDYLNYDILISAPGVTGTSDKTAILQQAFAAGKSVLTFGVNNTTTQVPHITTTSAGVSIAWGVTPPAFDTPLPGTFTTQASGTTASGQRPTAIAAGALVVSSWINGGGPTFYTGSIQTNKVGGKWLDIHLPVVDVAQIQAFLLAGMRWLQDYALVRSYEAQMGEFCIDRINDQNFPFQVKITGRDYTKRCLNSKFALATGYSQDDDSYDTVYSLAINSGIAFNKILLPNLNQTLGTAVTYDKATPRWTPMKDIYNSFGYEIYFDREGNLTARPYQDPTLGVPTITFQTGLPDGNLVTIDRSINDGNLFNHLCVYSDNATTGVPFFGEAINTDPTSPTNVDEIGDRYDDLDLNYLQSDADCQAMADLLLKTTALESYEMNLSSLYYPWLDAGDIAEVLDPDRYNFEPTKYLMDTLTLQLGLGPMSSTAKRITYVGSSG